MTPRAVRMPRFCAVVGCSNRSDKNIGKMFYDFPKSKEKGGNERRKLWLQSIYGETFSEEMINIMSICSDHFVNGHPAFKNDPMHPDYVPSVNMGYERTNSRSLEQYRKSKMQMSVKAEAENSSTQDETIHMKDDGGVKDLKDINMDIKFEIVKAEEDSIDIKEEMINEEFDSPKLSDIDTHHLPLEIYVREKPQDTFLEEEMIVKEEVVDVPVNEGHNWKQIYHQLKTTKDVKIISQDNQYILTESNTIVDENTPQNLEDIMNLPDERIRRLPAENFGDLPMELITNLPEDTIIFIENETCENPVTITANANKIINESSHNTRPIILRRKTSKNISSKTITLPPVHCQICSRRFWKFEHFCAHMRKFHNSNIKD